MENQHIFVVYTNKNLTDGDGPDYPFAYAMTETVAKRLAKGKYIQGTDGYYKKVEIIDGKISIEFLRIVKPTKEEVVAEQKAQAKNEVIKKAKALGLTQEELELIMISE